MNIVIDIILAIAILLGAIIGLRRGFISTVARPVKFVLCLVIAFSFASLLAESVIDPVIGDGIENQISDFIEEKIEEDGDGEFELPTLLKLASSIMDVDLSSVENGEGYADALADKIASPVIHLVGVIISFILLYLVSKLLLGIVFKLLDSMFDSGMVGALNMGLGLVFNTAFTMIILWGAVSIFEFIINTNMLSGVSWLSQFEGGFIYNFFKDYNPIDLLLSF